MSERTPSQMADAHDALREKATPGPWFGPRVTDDFPPGWVGVYQAYADTGNPVPGAVIGITGRYDEESVQENAAYITALANDDAAMCAAVRERDAFRAALEEIANDPAVRSLEHPMGVRLAAIARAALNPGGGDG